MTLARRLLGSAGGTGAFTPPPGYVAAGNLVASGSPVTIDAGTGYKGFPGLCVMPNGNLLLVYRHGTDHATTQDGILKSRTSSDGGATWSAAATILDPASDARDPSVVTLSDDRIALSYFLYNGTVGTAVEVMFSDDNAATWGSPVTMTDSFSAEVACSAPVVEVSPSLLLQPIYGRDAAPWTAAVLSSTDGGGTWGSQVTIATGASKDWTEPWIARRGDGTLHCLIRELVTADLWRSTSSNDGASWSAAASAFDGISRAAQLRTAHGAIMAAYRVTGDDGYYRTSWDDGATWEAAAALPSPSGTFEYAAAAQLTSGGIVVAWGNEASSTDADLYCQAYLDTGP